MQSKCEWKNTQKKQNTLDLSLLVHVACVLVESLFPSMQFLNKFLEIIYISGDATISVHGGTYGQAVVLHVSPHCFFCFVVMDTMVNHLLFTVLLSAWRYPNIIVVNNKYGCPGPRMPSLLFTGLGRNNEMRGNYKDMIMVQIVLLLREQNIALEARRY